MKHINVIEKQSGKAFELKKGERLTVIDPNGEQVSDMVIFNQHDLKEKLSSGKSLDFEESILLTKGNFLWSNRSNKMVEILEDTNGRNDFLLAPCSQETFEIMYNYEGDHPSCQDNLSKSLVPFGVDPDDIPTAFNIFMNVQFSENGKLRVLPPTSKAGDYVTFEAKMDLLICLTACSAEDSNGGSFKPIHFKIIPRE
ncbi:urea carboxylase-associated family protein [Tamlana sp. 2_MG-2023]|uniref:urea carboxylase-associated family protein n=1 Tax=unclassified Tamlana TaxID=2614803 RepID=UPI0026E23459|nr:MULTISPECIES: urea carboxylase-associated family protein [unclassified Tamlana]MDO6760215.1 urea carboxylase-associated family protein [Tamlana sp. 2_MG-2023]MDO6790087.1 urea carboxylase-associated family protein [Tamlana sp. 1_MG-2023]